MSEITVRSRLALIFALSALLAWSVGSPSAVQADPGQGMAREGRSGHEQGMHGFAKHVFHSLLRHQKELGLSAEQTAKIKSVATDYVKTRIREKADVKLAEVDVRTLVRNENADLSAIESAMRKAEDTRLALRLDEVKAVRAATAVLTPEQREKWRAVRMDRHGKRHADGERAEMSNDDSETTALLHDFSEKEG